MKFKFFSFVFSILILAIMALALAEATFIESSYGSEAARKIVYGTKWFEGVLLFFVVNLIGSLFYYKTFSWKKISVPLFHTAFVLIVAGAALTRYTGIDGSISIREESTENRVVTSNGQLVTLPFDITLNDFKLERYPGSNSPSSYSSQVTITDRSKGETFGYSIYMNHILKYRGWRFFQSSYDRDEMGTVLTATHDVYGTFLTYLGYFFAVVAMLASLLMPGTYFRRQLSQLKTTITVLFLFFLLPISAFSAKPDTQKIVPPQQAEAFSKLVIQDSKGKMKTMNTFDREFMRKIYGKENMDNLTADQVVLSILTFPEYWGNVELIKISNSLLRDQLQAKGKWISYNSMFDENGNYLLSSMADMVFMKQPKQQSKADKAIMELDDKMEILQGVLSGEAFSLFSVPNDENNKWYTGAEAALLSSPGDSLFLASALPLYLKELNNGIESGNFEQANKHWQSIMDYQKNTGKKIYPSDKKIKAELLYNKTNLFNRMKPIFGLCGFVLLIVIFTSLFKGKGLNRVALKTFWALTIIFFAIISLGIGLRWYIGGFVPLSNAYETMLFITWVSLLIGIIFAYRQPISLALSLILGFTFLFVAGINNSNPAIGNLVPVLKSPWLSIHVAVITSSYALFAMVMLVALINIVLFALTKPSTFVSIQQKTSQMGILMQILSIIGLYLLTIGTIFGAVWANQSWGRYWGWDPKETWALISILVYAFVGHMRLIPSLKDEFWFNLASFWAFSSILMTFFGVNYFLTGMHSYAGTADATIPRWLIYVVDAFILLSIVSGIKYFKNKKSANKIS